MQATKELRALIELHPWKLLAVAFGVGAYFGLAERPRAVIGRALAASIGTATLSAVRDFAARQVADRVQSWIDQGGRSRA